MQVFVANPTLQNREFHYRIPGIDTPRMLPIRAGGQSQMPEDLDGTELQSIIKQLERTGAVPASEVSSIVLPKALIFDVRSNPINVDKIAEGLKKDEDARQEVSSQKLEEAGLGAFKIAETHNPGKVIETSVEIVEVTDRGATKGGVDTEFVVSTKPGRSAGRKRTEKKK